MGWIREARNIMQQKYGYYVSMCRELKIEPVPYYAFKMADYHEVRGKYKFANSGLARVKF